MPKNSMKSFMDDPFSLSVSCGQASWDERCELMVNKVLTKL